MRTDPLAVTFGEWLQKQREDRGWTLEILYEYSGITKATLSRLENGIQTKPRNGTLEMIVRGLCHGSDDSGLYGRLIREAKMALAGVLDDPDELVRDRDPDTAYIAEAYDGMNESDRDQVRKLVELIERANRALSVGGGMSPNERGLVLADDEDDDG